MTVTAIMHVSWHAHLDLIMSPKEQGIRVVCLCFHCLRQHGREPLTSVRFLSESTATKHRGKWGSPFYTNTKRDVTTVWCLTARDVEDLAAGQQPPPTLEDAVRAKYPVLTPGDGYPAAGEMRADQSACNPGRRRAADGRRSLIALISVPHCRVHRCSRCSPRWCC